ncbi:hypothetical protein [Allorhizobium ampelinum]|uniref:hypothetical protein n=1 Tax=Allorhizobium ampelinum TaxID=3025782 RepID=UPI000B406552|nr:hypothetical protein [Allorhizobium ampelinum]NTA27434.1 hypothetical protein [Allorhizobium ampelinum]OVE94491.1 hypothetical protein B7W85_13140 [Allorhizobium ampelinum]
MNHLAFKNPSRYVQGRSTINAMTEQWIAAHGQPRRFKRGFSGTWMGIQHALREFGYNILMERKRYVIFKVGEESKKMRMDRTACLNKIDEILIENGMEPLQMRPKS